MGDQAKTKRKVVDEKAIEAIRLAAMQKLNDNGQFEGAESGAMAAAILAAIEGRLHPAFVE